CTHPIRPVPRGYAAQLPQRVLQTFTQALETLRKADRYGLPSRVGQHEMVDQVLERLSLDCHPQIFHACKVRRPQPAWFVHLREEHFLRRSPEGPPAPHLALQRSQLPLGKSTGVAPLQLTEDRLGLEARLLLQYDP